MDQKEYKGYIKKNKCGINNLKNWPCYIPRKIEGQCREVRRLAVNILLGRYTVRNGKNVIAHALYELKSSTLKASKKDDITCISINYYNELDRRAKIVLKCFFSEDGMQQRYEATKYFENKMVGVAEGGDDWNRFFMQVSLLGFVEGEKVRFEGI